MNLETLKIVARKVRKGVANNVSWSVIVAAVAVGLGVSVQQADRIAIESLDRATKEDADRNVGRVWLGVVGGPAREAKAASFVVGVICGDLEDDFFAECAEANAVPWDRYYCDAEGETKVRAVELAVTLSQRNAFLRVKDRDGVEVFWQRDDEDDRSKAMRTRVLTRIENAGLSEANCEAGQ